MLYILNSEALAAIAVYINIDTYIKLLLLHVIQTIACRGLAGVRVYNKQTNIILQCVHTLKLFVDHPLVFDVFESSKIYQKHLGILIILICGEGLMQ